MSDFQAARDHFEATSVIAPMGPLPGDAHLVDDAFLSPAARIARFMKPVHGLTQHDLPPDVIDNVMSRLPNFTPPQQSGSGPPEPEPAPLTLSPAESVQESAAIEPGTPQYSVAQQAMQKMMAQVDKGKEFINSAAGQQTLVDLLETGVQTVLSLGLPGLNEEQTMDYFLNASPDRLREKLGEIVRTPMWRSRRMRMPELGDLEGSGERKAMQGSGHEFMGAGTGLALQLGLEQIQPGYRVFHNLVQR